MAGVRDHTELDVWRLSDQLSVRVREVIDRAVRYIVYLQTATPPHLPKERPRSRRRREPEP